MNPAVILIDNDQLLRYHLFMEIKCDQCNTIFSLRPSKIKRANKHFCSIECRKAYFLEQKIIKNISKKVRHRNECFNKIIKKQDYAIVIIESKKFGIKEVLIDKNKIEEVSKIFWHVQHFYDNYYSAVGYDKNLKKEVFMHRYLTNCPKGLIVDHINRNSLDNRLKNLRCVNTSLNQLNSSVAKDSLSQHKGVRLRENGRYQARITINGKTISIGHFSTLEEAVKARKDFCISNNIIA